MPDSNLSPSKCNDTENRLISSQKLKANHPCMDETAHETVARLHLPVAPRCNILCGYCEREVCPSNINDVFPGISATILSPAQAVEKTDSFLAK